MTTRTGTSIATHNAQLRRAQEAAEAQQRARDTPPLEARVLIVGALVMLGWALMMVVA